MTLLNKCKWMLITSLVCLFLSITLTLLNVRLVKLQCFLCKGDISNISYLEYVSGSFRYIPCLHPVCASQVADVLAPNSYMTVGQWLEIRGWEPRHQDLSNKSFDELLTR